MNVSLDACTSIRLPQRLANAVTETIVVFRIRLTLLAGYMSCNLELQSNDTGYPVNVTIGFELSHTVNQLNQTEPTSNLKSTPET
jgi:hypothetical protein